jgi:UDP-N-acetylmuramate dehydrogenase
MMKIQENISLKAFNTFGIDKKARYFCEVSSKEEVISSIEQAEKLGVPIFILGGGSNILLLDDLPYFVLKMNIKGISKVAETNEHVFLDVGAGEGWHEFVMYCIENDLAGVENLSLIPGTVGASPMQNIGAYGVEIESIFQELFAIHRQTKKIIGFNWEQCKFGYRESIFKSELKDQFIICNVVFKLSKIAHFNIEYGAIKSTLQEMGIENLSLKAVSEAVVHIRQSKLPDPKIVGNAGSFFKNPTIDPSHFEKLKEIFPDVPGYSMDEGIKVPAAWLIEKAGWKGKRAGQVGVHPSQPLVLVNYGGCEGKEIVELSSQIQQSVKDKFGIFLNPEVNFIK